MKKLLLIFVIGLFYDLAYSQVWFGMDAYVIHKNADSVYLECEAYFQWGPGGNVDWLKAYDIRNQHDTVFLKLYYSYPGTAIFGGSVTQDTISVKPVPATANYLTIYGYWVGMGNDTIKNIDYFDTTILLSPLRVPEFGRENRIILFPNPARNYFSISMRNGSQINEIFIYNMDGILIQKEKFYKVIDISALSKGQHIIFIDTDEGTIRTHLMKE